MSGLWTVARVLAEIVGWLTITIGLIAYVRKVRLDGKRARIKQVIAAGFTRDLANGQRWPGAFTVDLLGEQWVVDLDPSTIPPSELAPVFIWTRP